LIIFTNVTALYLKMKIKYLLLLVGILFSCHAHSPRALKQLLKEFELALPQAFPDYAAAMGNPQATDILVIPTRKKIREHLDFCQKYLKAFESFDQFTEHRELNEERVEKLEILEGMIQQMTGPRSPFNDPGFYHVYPALAWRMSEIRQDSDSTKANLLLKTLNKIPFYFAHAKANLDDPNITRTISAIDLQEKTLNFLGTTVVAHINSLQKDSTREKLEIAQEKAAIAIKDYSAFCKSILVELKRLEHLSEQ